MSDLAKLEEMYRKETGLYRMHKEKAERLKQKIEEEKGQAIIKSVRNLNLSPEEFMRLQKALADEKNVRKLMEGQMEEMWEAKQMSGGEVPDGTGKGREEAVEGD